MHGFYLNNNRISLTNFLKKEDKCLPNELVEYISNENQTVSYKPHFVLNRLEILNG